MHYVGQYKVRRLKILMLMLDLERISFRDLKVNSDVGDAISESPTGTHVYYPDPPDRVFERDSGKIFVYHGAGFSTDSGMMGGEIESEVEVRDLRETEYALLLQHLKLHLSLKMIKPDC
jgi:hypothetical protein